MQTPMPSPIVPIHAIHWAIAARLLSASISRQLPRTSPTKEPSMNHLTSFHRPLRLQPTKRASTPRHLRRWNLPRPQDQTKPNPRRSDLSSPGSQSYRAMRIGNLSKRTSSIISRQRAQYRIVRLPRHHREIPKPLTVTVRRSIAHHHHYRHHRLPSRPARIINHSAQASMTGMRMDRSLRQSPRGHHRRFNSSKQKGLESLSRGNRRVLLSLPLLP